MPCEDISDLFLLPPLPQDKDIYVYINIIFNGIIPLINIIFDIVIYLINIIFNIIIYLYFSKLPKAAQLHIQSCYSNMNQLPKKCKYAYQDKRLIYTDCLRIH